MAQSARLRVRNLGLPTSQTQENVIKLNDVEINVTKDGDATTTYNPDGTVRVDFGKDTIAPANTGFYKNLAETIDEGELDRIANELIEDIDSDIRSRTEWMEIRRRGIELLGFKIEDPRTDIGTSSAPLEGMSSIRHPLLAEAVLRFQANARGELLPATGPVKVRSDMPMPPDGAQPDPYQNAEDLSDALEIDFNHYLTVTCPEYYPDTDRMLFSVGFGGIGFKKIYNCPIRRRPVSESVDASDLIVSNSATDLKNSGRITHRIKMRPSILKRMQLVGAYRDADLLLSSQPLTVTPTEKAIGEVQGIKQQNTIGRVNNQDQELYETYCELDIDGMEHKEGGKVSGLRLPYKVTIHVASRQILEVRRNWLKGDKMYMPREYFVDYQFIPAFGFYPLGLVHILGNTTNTLTAAWREMIDNGMFSNFPGFIYAKQAGRQLSNQFRVPPGGGVGLDTGGGRLQDAVMPLPYKDVSVAFSSFIQHVEEYGQKLGSTAETNIGEGKQEVPVGTTLAMIEQATKLMDAVHKRLHAAQSKEFQLLKDRFAEDPEAFWRFNKFPAFPWEKEQFVNALNNYAVVPVADPNNPTSLHRLAKASAIKMLQQASPTLYDPMAVDKRIMRIAGVDPEGLFLSQPAPTPPDPRLEAINAKREAQGQTAQDKAQDRASRERIEAMKIELERMQLQQEAIIHASDAQREDVAQQHNLLLEHQAAQQKLALQGQMHQQKLVQQDQQHKQKMQHEVMKTQFDAANKQMEVQANAQAAQMDLHNKAAMSEIQLAQQATAGQQANQQKIDSSQQMQDSKLQQQAEAHSQKLEQTQEMHKANLEAAKAQAKIKPKAPAKGK